MQQWTGEGLFDVYSKEQKEAQRKYRDWYRKREQMKLYPSLASRAYKLAKKACYNCEKKRYQFASTSTITTTWNIIDITDIDQGDLVTTRDGNKISVFGFKMKLVINTNQSATTSQSVRFIVFRDFQGNAGDPTIDTVGASNLLNSSVGVDMTHPRNPATISRYQILMDKVITFNKQAITADGPQEQWCISKWFMFKKRPKKVCYRDQTGTNHTSGGYWFAIVSDDGTNPPNFHYMFDVVFGDV